MREKFNRISKEAFNKSDLTDNLIMLKQVSPTNTLWFLPGALMGCNNFWRGNARVVAHLFNKHLQEIHLCLHSIYVLIKKTGNGCPNNNKKK